MEKLLWLDMEMTGLDVSKEVPIEVAAVVTGWDLIPLDSYETVIQQPQSFLDAMDDWNKKHHGESGLVAKIPHGKEPLVAESELIAFVEKHFGTEPAILAGNSIFQDRIFINKYFPRLNARLHYRMVDVTSWKVVVQAKLGVKFDKNNRHRAVDDIHESINELKFYLQYLKQP